MPYADPEKNKECIRRWHKKNDNRIQRKRRLKNMLLIERIKLEEGCQFCGYNNNAKALQFHHLDPNSKNFTISNHLNNRSTKTILRETELCIVLCANCHAIEEHNLNEKRLY